MSISNFISSLLLTAIGLSCYSCSSSPEQITPPNNRIDQKYGPSDEFFIQRAGPDGTFDLKAYTQALKSVTQQAKSRSMGGFNQDWTTQGPGNIGARVNTIAVNPQDENIIYAGFSEGGVFKTTNGGDDWVPIFDDQAFLSIGDIILDPTDPNTVYVGTGDVNISGYPFIGDGLYRSTDGGATWTNLGLEEQRIISKIVVDPQTPTTIFVATMGIPFERNNDRGLYRSTDNGDTWKQVLFLSDSTGVVDLVINPDNPQIMFAVGWDRIRNNRESLISGDGARMYRSINGGEDWEMVEGGLPNNQRHSRLGLAMYEADPNIMYVVYVGANSRFEAIYRTDDGGINWNPIPSDNSTGLSNSPLGGFGWYFAKIRVNPDDPDDLHLLGVDLWRTKNAGNTWESTAPPWWTYEVHADKHDLVFLSDGGVVLGTDGGIYRSDAAGTQWTDIENIPTTQFYRVAYNPHQPDLYYGGAQDNGSTGGNAATINEWARIYGGDGFQMAFDRQNPDRFFTETQNGNLNVTLDGGYTFEFAGEGIGFTDRKNWDMPYIISPHEDTVMYTGTEKIYQGLGDKPFWTAISTDLTDGTQEEHRYHNITALDESPVEEGLLYVGTGDGNLWRGDTTGNNWESISNNLPDQYVTSVKGSPFDANTVYVTYSGYRDNDFLPRIHRSTDRGDNWEDISNDLPDLAINDLLVLPMYSDSVLFVATDGGVYGSITAGTTWERLGTNMPTITVYDLEFNVAKNELVAGTFARSIMSYPLDSILVMDNLPVSTAKPTALKEKGLQVLPTLATDVITINVENTEPGRTVDLAVIALDGRLMHQAERLAGPRVEYTLDVSNFPPGQYFVKAKIRHKVVSTPFIRQ